MTDLVFDTTSNQGLHTAMMEGMRKNVGWNVSNMICPFDQELNPRGELLMQLTKCKNNIKGAVESVHLWISLVGAMEWKNKGGEYYVSKSGMEDYFNQCAAIINLIQEQAPRPINTTADIFALNEPLKRYADVIWLASNRRHWYSSPKHSGGGYSGVVEWVAG